MKITLTTQQYEYLKSTLYKEKEDLFEKLEAGKLSQNLFELNEDDADIIRDWASEKLLKVGFDDDYQLNEEGRHLEDTIDIFYK